MHVLLQFLYSILLAAVVFAAINLSLLLGWLGNPRSIAFLAQVRRIVNAVPSGTVFSCQGNEVSAVVYDPSIDEERAQSMYRANAIVSFLVWSGGSRSVAHMRRTVSKEMILHICCLVLCLASVIAAGIWLAIAAHWVWIFAVLLFLEWQIMSGYAGSPIFVKWGFCTGLVAVVFFHRTGWLHFPIWVIYLYTGIWLALSPLVMLWAVNDKE